jgi:hypothetical protein
MNNDYPPLFNITDGVIEVYTKNHYGKEFIYIKDAKVSLAIQNLTGNKTLSQYDIHHLKRLGFTFKVVLERETL